MLKGNEEILCKKCGEFKMVEMMKTLTKCNKCSYTKKYKIESTYSDLTIDDNGVYWVVRVKTKKKCPLERLKEQLKYKIKEWRSSISVNVYERELEELEILEHNFKNNDM